MEGVFGTVPKIVTLFQIKMFNFSYPIYDQTKNLIPTLDMSIKSIYSLSGLPPPRVIYFLSTMLKVLGSAFFDGLINNNEKK